MVVTEQMANAVRGEIIELALVRMSVLLRLPARNVFTNDDRAEKERAVRVDVVRVIFAAERLAAYAVERREREDRKSVV